MLASLNGHIEVVKMLLSKGANRKLKGKVSMGRIERGYMYMGGLEGWRGLLGGGYYMLSFTL